MIEKQIAEELEQARKLKELKAKESVLLKQNENLAEDEEDMNEMYSHTKKNYKQSKRKEKRLRQENELSKKLMTERLRKRFQMSSRTLLINNKKYNGIPLKQHSVL